MFSDRPHRAIGLMIGGLIALALPISCATSTDVLSRGTSITRVQDDFGLPDVISDQSGNNMRFYLPSTRPADEWPGDAPRTFYYLQRDLAVTFVHGKLTESRPIGRDLRTRVLEPFAEGAQAAEGARRATARQAASETTGEKNNH